MSSVQLYDTTLRDGAQREGISFSVVDKLHITQRLDELGIRFIEGEAMMAYLSAAGVAAASGSACTAKYLKSSHVLEAMGMPAELAQGSLLFTLGITNTSADVDLALKVLPGVVEKLRNISPLYAKFMKESKVR